MWRNIMKGKHSYQGHKESGFETEEKVYSPASPFCPFQHCKSGLMTPFDVDLTVLTPTKENEDLIKSSKSNRRLFTPEKNSEKIQNPSLICDENINLLPQESMSFAENIEGSVSEIENTGNPSPTKEDLIKETKILKLEIELMKKQMEKTDHENKNSSLEQSKTNLPKITLIECKVENCGKTFNTLFGMQKHQRQVHGADKVENNSLHSCPICGKSVKYIDQHIRSAHREISGNKTCEICNKVISTDMRKHRGSCTFCPFCNFKESRKNRLLKHIVGCLSRPKMSGVQVGPLDLSSPKKDKNNLDKKHSKNEDTISRDSESISNKAESENLKNYNKNKEMSHDTPEDELDEDALSQTSEYLQSPDLTCDELAESLSKKQAKYPFDNDDADESYISEYEENDDEEFTKLRRLIKDKLEIELREVDSMENSEQSGDDEFVNKFRQFMQTKKRRGKSKGEFKKMNEVSTIDMYTGAIKHHILPAFHKLYSPFNSLWILDCTATKDCLFDGQRRIFVDHEEPIYMTSTILQEALQRIDSYCGESGSERGTILAATSELLDFIELHFNNTLNIYGPGPLQKLMPYHNGVRTFVKATCPFFHIKP